MNSAYGSNKYTDKQIEFVKDKAENSDLTWEQLAKAFNKKFKMSATMNSIRHIYRTYKDVEPKDPEVIELNKPKVLIYDVETAPIMGYVWSLWKQNVALNQIEKDSHLLSWSAKWLDEDEVMYADQRHAKNIEDDKKIVAELWKLLDEADIVITQNGKSFDDKVVNARFVMHGMKPPSTFRHIDTKLIAKKHFRFTSNKLQYMTDKLCKKYKKSGHAKFPGFSMWKECMKGNVEAFEEMKAYNELDVLSLEELYKILIAWDSTVDFNVYHDSDGFICTCGHTELKKNGFHYTNLAKYQRYTCTNCGKEYRDGTNLLSKEKRKNLKRKTLR
jgi:hypothetical protein